mmetsp:Transcript_5086/g.7543  ORF Transcript_5086/g.7543 Transcript_5086/m.7543 type:complete len:87 (-) Transcript_5086:685-945(-)
MDRKRICCTKTKTSTTNAAAFSVSPYYETGTNHIQPVPTADSNCCCVQQLMMQIKFAKAFFEIKLFFNYTEIVFAVRITIITFLFM